jgi:hypothetical protein
VHYDILGGLEEKGEAVTFPAANDDELHHAFGGGANDLALDVASTASRMRL